MRGGKFQDLSVEQEWDHLIKRCIISESPSPTFSGLAWAHEFT